MVDPIPDSRCVACREPINSGASICHHCGCAQRKSSWSRISDAIKWVGGVVTVISLFIGATTLSGYYGDWRSRNNAVAELVEASQWLLRSGHYPEAWQALDDALELHAGGSAARRARLDLAQIWVRNFRVSGSGERDAERLDAISAALYRGIARANADELSTILAHLAWAQYRRFELGHGASGDLDELLAEALASSPGNAYANAMYAFIRLRADLSAENIAEQESRFVDAAQATASRAYVRRLQLAAFADLATGGGTEHERLALAGFLRALAQMRDAGERPPADWLRDRLFSRAYGRSGNVALVESTLDVLTPQQHLTVLDWLTEGAGAATFSSDSPALTWRYLRARLLEASGEEETALAQYLGLQGQGGTDLNALTAQAITRLQRGS